MFADLAAVSEVVNRADRRSCGATMQGGNRTVQLAFCSARAHASRMSPNDPINTLAQWRIWQIEFRVLSTIGAAILGAVIFAVAMVFGARGAEIAYFVVFGGLGLIVLFCVYTVIRTLVFGPKRDDDMLDPAKWAKIPD
jgi:hypothetical protein